MDETVYTFWYRIFEPQYVFYTRSTSQFLLATFQGKNVHVGVVATTLDSTVTDY